MVIDLNLLELFFLANIFSTSPRSLFFLCPGVRLKENCEQAPGEGSVTRREASGAGVGLLDSIYADPWYPNLVSCQATAFYFSLPRTGNFRGEFFMLTQPYGYRSLFHSLQFHPPFRILLLPFSFLSSPLASQTTSIGGRNGHTKALSIACRFLSP